MLDNKPKLIRMSQLMMVVHQSLPGARLLIVIKWGNEEALLCIIGFH